MNIPHHSQLGEVCRFVSGGTPRRNVARYFQGDIPWITGTDVTSDVILKARHYITPEAIESSATNVVAKGNILLVTRTGVGKVAIAGVDICISQDFTGLIPDTERLDVWYLFYYLRAKEQYLVAHQRGATIQGITREVVATLSIPLPPLPEQKRIATILAKADRLRRLRRYARTLSDTYLQSVSLQLFGDPVTNPMGWSISPLRTVSYKFQDGPFGSNLKTSHYQASGVRVIRLQNIGVGELVDDDQAFISEAHFATISKHRCEPGDVIVGTLGDPNLRACILPKSIPLALNKADCVQIRVDPKKATADFICWLLNLPQTLFLARGMIHGQTRSRISMGQLARLEVPIPPLSMQKRFDEIVHKFERLRAQQREAERQAEHLFQTLLHRAFEGGL